MENPDNNPIGPVPLILKYAKYLNQKCRFTVECNKSAQYNAKLYFKESVYVGKGSSKQEARCKAARSALGNFEIPECLKKKQHTSTQRFHIPSQEKLFKCRRLRQKHLSSLNRGAYEKGRRKKDNSVDFLIKSNKGQVGIGFTRKEAKETMDDQTKKPLDEDHDKVFYEIYTPNCSKD